jgi:tetrahydromethanopterin S-methyltransferase subunit G
MFAVQEIAAQATDQISRGIILGSLVIGLILAIQAVAILAWA